MSWGATSRLQRFWDIRAACNFIGGGTGSSLLFWAALGLFAGLPYIPAAPIGLLLIAAGLFMVWLETGKPWRAFNLFFRPQTSWMTREGIVALPLFALGVVSVLLDMGALLPAISISPVAPAAITAILGLTFLYCQLRILNSSRGLPAWREPMAMALIGLSGFAEGFGIYLVLSAILGVVAPAMMAILLVLITARAVVWRAYIAALGRSRAPESTIAALGASQNGFLITGHALPVVFIVFAYLWPGMATIFLALAGLATTLGGWLLKVVLITKAAYIAKTVIPKPPVRGRPSSSPGTQRTI